MVFLAADPIVSADQGTPGPQASQNQADFIEKDAKESEGATQPRHLGMVPSVILEYVRHAKAHGKFGRIGKKEQE
jgi:hypothetical protein